MSKADYTTWNMLMQHIQAYPGRYCGLYYNITNQVMPQQHLHHLISTFGRRAHLVQALWSLDADAIATEGWIWIHSMCTILKLSPHPLH